MMIPFENLTSLYSEIRFLYAEIAAGVQSLDYYTVSHFEDLGELTQR